MSSFLTERKSKESYQQRISTEPIKTQRCRLYAMKNFEQFVSATYEKTTDDVIEELLLTKKNDRENKFEEILYDMLQKWINWNEKTDKKPQTIRVAFSNLRKYLFYRGIKTNEQDIREYLRFPKIPKEERYPLSTKEYRAIVDGFSRTPLFQAACLALGSSGMRIGELMRIKKRHLDLSKKRIKVTIPADAKTRAGRITYFSKETLEKLQKRLEKIGPDDYVFCHQSPESGSTTLRKGLTRLVDKLGFDERYQTNNIRKITSHSFRAYFFTKAARKHGENYAHRMIGHGGYLLQYDRMTEDEKLNMYLDLEPDLMVIDQMKNELEIKKLREENESIIELREEVKKLREQQSKQDKRILDKLRKEGIIPALKIIPK